MRRRLVIITEIISPYRIPLFNVLAREPNVDLHVIFLAETDPGLRQWKVYKEEIRFSYEVLSSWRKQIGVYNLLLDIGIIGALRRARPDLILCGGYSYVASWQALFWSRWNSVPFLLWSESNRQDIRGGHSSVELLKRAFLRECSGFVVPGRSAAQYLLDHGVKERDIFTAVNAVDNDFFCSAAARARQSAPDLQNKFGLPARYVLYSGRLVRQKGVFELLAAYAKLESSLREQMGLVFAGDGSCRGLLEERCQSISPGVVKFAGFVQREQLPIYYALAEMLILPTYTDTWGLVVNEAMACGLPVIVSQAAGCAADLVTQGWNGDIVDPTDVNGLSERIRGLAMQPELRASMSMNGRNRIQSYSPEEWTKGIVHMLAKTGEVRA